MTGNLTGRMTVVEGDITRLSVDAIVNAANGARCSEAEALTARSTGRPRPELLTECRTLGGCPTGGARMTSGYRLPARHVIHTVGPVYRDGESGEADALRSCYRESLRLAEEAGLRTIAFPCISTGVYGYPQGDACEVAVKAVSDWLKSHELPASVTFCCFSADDAVLYRRRLKV